jgi:hypothetical protein
MLYSTALFKNGVGLPLVQKKVNRQDAMNAKVQKEKAERQSRRKQVKQPRIFTDDTDFQNRAE